jgi:superfamily II DNA/RNA helicase
VTPFLVGLLSSEFVCSFQALEVHGIKVFCLTGAMEPEKRTFEMDLWRAESATSVLAFSNVATNGLNFTEASIVIHYVRIRHFPILCSIQ